MRPPVTKSRAPSVATDGRRVTSSSEARAKFESRLLTSNTHRAQEIYGKPIADPTWILASGSPNY
jgi:hypothetical protein